MLDGITELTRTLSEDGVKVVADVEEDVYLKLFATIVAAVIVGSLGYFIVKSVFK